MVTLSQLWDPNDKPSVQVKALLDAHRLDNPIQIDELEWVLKAPIQSVLYQIDSEYIPLATLRTLAHHLRCQAAYLIRIHEDYRRNVLHVSDAAVKKIIKQRQDEVKSSAKQTQEGRARVSRVKDNGPGFGLPDELILY
jgi:hypothetical protein